MTPSCCTVMSRVGSEEGSRVQSYRLPVVVFARLAAEAGCERTSSGRPDAGGLPHTSLAEVSSVGQESGAESYRLNPSCREASSCQATAVGWDRVAK